MTLDSGEWTWELEGGPIRRGRSRDSGCRDTELWVPGEVEGRPYCPHSLGSGIQPGFPGTRLPVSHLGVGD